MRDVNFVRIEQDDSKEKDRQNTSNSSRYSSPSTQYNKLKRTKTFNNDLGSSDEFNR